MERKYGKLVRDKMPDIIKSQGNIPVYRTLSDDEYIEYLNKKLKEEVGEYLEHNSTEELCDIYEVLNAILTANNITKEEIEAQMADKRLKNGAFKYKILLEKTI